jgi:hypothetical protein
MWQQVSHGGSAIAFRFAPRCGYRGMQSGGVVHVCTRTRTRHLKGDELLQSKVKLELGPAPPFPFSGGLRPSEPPPVCDRS